MVFGLEVAGWFFFLLDESDRSDKSDKSDGSDKLDESDGSGETQASNFKFQISNH